MPDILSVDRLLYIYHIVETDRKKRAWLRDEIFLRTYFLIPYTIKKSYFMTADLFNDASQNMAISILQAIEAFQPGIGFSFTNYLVGYFVAPSHSRFVKQTLSRYLRPVARCYVPSLRTAAGLLLMKLSAFPVLKIPSLTTRAALRMPGTSPKA